MNICVIGVGYVGLVTGAGLAELGNRVICVDVDNAKLVNIKKGKMPFYEEGLEPLVAKNQQRERLSFSGNIDEGVRSAEIIYGRVNIEERKNDCSHYSGKNQFESISRQGIKRSRW